MIFILKIAGQDIIFAIFRYFAPRGSEVFIINPNRHISRYYRVAKDGVFNIDGKMYVTNPNKLLGLSDDMKREVKLSMSMGYRRLQKGIDKLENQKAIILKQIASCETDPRYLHYLDNLKMQLADLDNKIELLRSKQEKREQQYYYQRRGVYIYIEGDPVPKDLHEWFTEMDSVQLENIIVRAQTKDPKVAADIEKTLTWLKKFIIMALIAAALAAIIAFKNSSHLEQIGQSIGVRFQI